MISSYNLDINDLGNPTSYNNANNFYNKIKKIWNNYKHLKRNALFKTIIKVNYGLIILIIVLCILQAGVYPI